MIQQVRVKPVFNRRNVKLDAGKTAPIHLEVYFSRDKRVFIHTNINIRQEDWGTSGKFLNKIKPTQPNHIELNHFIANKIADIESYAYYCYNSGKQFTPDTLNSFLDNKHIAISFYDFYEKQMLNDNNKLSIESINAHQGTLKLLKNYREHLDFSELTYEYLQELDGYLRTKLKLHQNTIHKHHKHIRRYINEAIKLKYFKTEDNPYIQFKAHTVESDRANLSIQEFNAIKNLTFAPNEYRLEYARDLFIFSCTTGLRFGDVFNLSREHVDRKNDSVTIRIVMQKTEHKKNTKVILPLDMLFDGIPKRILDKYDKGEDGKVFKKLTNAILNAYLDEIGERAKVNTDITFHVARHTFGTFLAHITANPYLIMQLMGHADIKTSMIYIHQNEERLIKSLQKFDKSAWTLIED